MQNQIQILGWTYGQKDFHLSLDMNIQNMPGEPSNNPEVSPVSESPTLLTSDLDNFGLQLYCTVLFPHPSIHECIKKGKGDQAQFDLAACLLTKTYLRGR